MKRVLNPTYGSDIEVFLMHKDTREVVSAEGYVKGTKNAPFNFDQADPYFATSLDNILAEFCIPPVTDRERFWQYIQKSLGYINSTLPESLCTVALPSAILHDKYLQTEQAKTFGCEPDYNCWTRSQNPKPAAIDPETGEVRFSPNLRSAGFHLHVGYDDPSVQVSEMIIKAFDLHLSVPSVIQEPDSERKKLYGKAGAFRFKPYGVEYRSLSNYYVGDQGKINWVFQNMQLAVDFVNSDKIEVIDDYADQIMKAVNSGDKTLAGNLIREFDIPML